MGVRVWLALAILPATAVRADAQACMGYNPSARAPAVRDSMLVTAAWLAERLKDPAIVVVHVDQDRATYDEGHVPGARFVAFGDFTITRDGVPVELPDAERLVGLVRSLGISNQSRVVIYGPLQAAARFWLTLEYLGHGEQAALLDGGLDAWRAQGLTLIREAPAGVTGGFVARVNPDVVVDAGWVAARLRDSTVTVVDNRTLAEYLGEEQGTDLPRSGHITGARHLDWTDLVLDGRLKSATSLQLLFDQAGLSGAAEVVAYCRSGTRSAVFYFASRYLGLRTRLYDGSMSDWSRRDELPIDRGRPTPR